MSIGSGSYAAVGAAATEEAKERTGEEEALGRSDGRLKTAAEKSKDECNILAALLRVSMDEIVLPLTSAGLQE